MGRRVACLFALSVFGLAGCAQPASPLAADPMKSPGQPTGSLEVYAAPVTTPPGRDVGYDYPTYAAYEIDDATGHLLQRVYNRGADPAEPSIVTLPPGDYTVVARANGGGEITLHVPVEVRAITVVHLDSAAGRPAAAHSIQSAAGRVVGWWETTRSG